MSSSSDAGFVPTSTGPVTMLEEKEAIELRSTPSLDARARPGHAVASTHFRTLLAGLDGPTALTVDRAARPSGVTSEAVCALHPSLIARLREQCRLEGLALETLVQTTWCLMLARYGSTRDVVIGAQSALRTGGVHPVRLRIDDGATVIDCARPLETQRLAAESHAATTLADIRAAAGLADDATLFHSIVDVSDGASGIRRARVERAWLRLTLEAGEPSVLRVTYDTGVLTAEAAERTAVHVRTLLEGFAAGLDRDAMSLPLLDDVERRIVLTDWNATSSPRSGPACVHELFEAQAAQTPDALAVVHGDASLTYAELDRRAESLARRLRARVTGALPTVAVCLERSLAMPVAVLAALKVGAAYVPLAPEYPRDRLAYMLEEARVPVLVTERALGATLSVGGTEVLFVDDEAATDTPAFARPVRGGDDLAYVIFTSGSTGRPKGVAMRHGALTNLLAWQAKTSDVRAGGRTLQFAPLSFDVSFQEMFATWSTGGTLVLLSEDERRDPAALLAVLEGHRVERLFLPFVALQKLAEAIAERADVSRIALREVITAGEALRVSPAVRAMFQKLRGCVLENQYGPSETHVVTAYRLAGPVTAWPDLPPIGRPIENTSAYVLEPTGQPAPIGVPGELFLGGACLARGYLGRDDLTADRFVRDPFAHTPDARMYRTGDVVRWRADGEIEFLGRADHQVKIRGHRVELGEVEAVLGQCPGVGRVAVIAREDASGGRRLVAYVVAAENAAVPSAATLRAHVMARLPEYMVPAAFVPLSALPLSPSGKVDRKSLPEPDYDLHGLRREYVAPRTHAERALVAALQTALRLDRVGIDDDFFELGGDSLRGIGVLTAARDAGVPVTLRQLFEHTTPRTLAAALADDTTVATARAVRAPFAMITADDRAKLPADLEDAYPLTSLQAGMLFHSELGEGTGVYHEVFSYPLSAAPDVSTLQRALDQLVASHAALRTTFDLASCSEPLQRVHRTRSMPLQIVTANRDLDAWAHAERRRGFDLAHGASPVAFYLHPGATTYLSVSLQHAMLDGWSVATLVTELLDRYRALRRGTPRAIEAPVVAFRDFVALERDAVASDASRAFWDRQLDEAVVVTVPRMTRLAGLRPGDGPREVRVLLDADAVRSLTQLARASGAPLKSALLAAHLRVMALIAGQPDVVTGLVTNGRLEERDGDRALGLHLNTLPLRTRIDRGSWHELIAAVFTAERDAMPHRRYPMALLARQRGSAPFETAFNFMHFHVYDDPTAVADDLRAGEPRIATQTSFALTADFTLRNGSSSDDATLELCVGIGVPDVTREIADALAGYYARTLAAMVREPSAQPDRQDVLAPDERARLLRGWNDTWQPATMQGVLHAGFEAWAARTPEALAVVSGSESITYGALESRANRLARALVARGVGRGVRVALCIARSVDLVVAVYAVEKAGGAYVPLDTTYPADRIGYILESSRAPLVVAQSRFADRLPANVPSLMLDLARDEIAALSADPLPRTNGPGDLAYIIYTSGSTGRPKGVMVGHAAAANLVRWVNDTFALAPGDRGLAVSSVCFDLSVYDVFGLLDAGATIQMATEEEVRDPEALLSLLRREPITFWNSAPAVLQQLVPLFDVAGEAHGFDRLRRVFLSGDWIPVTLPDAIRGRFPRANVVSLGGATETAVWSNWFPIEHVDPRWPSIPYGRPIPNARYYVLDTQLQPLPVGVRGELFIAGPCLADGYAGREDLTAERFIRDPYAPSEEPDARMYRTGDLSRFFDDGNLEFLGRADHQVKLRGYRVELGEIETVLLRHAAVRSVAAIVRDDAPGGKRLVAYWVAREGASASSGELADHLRSAVPEYMVPAAWVELPALPLTSNGKLDRRALPKPESAADGRIADDEQPRTSTEITLAGLWREALGVEAVGTRSSFFELGGHSLLATQLVARARRAFGCDVPLRALFEAPTLGALATRIDAMRNRPVADPRPLRAHAILPADGIPLSFAQQRIAFMYALEPGSSVYNLCVGARLHGPLDTGAVQTALDALVARHPALRTTFETHAGRSVQHVHDASATTLRVHDLRDHPDAAREADRLVAAEADAPFDLEHAPPFRATLIVQTGSQAEILLNAHHIVSDGWSANVMLRDFAALYDAAVTHSEPSLASLPVQYADYALWQREDEAALSREHLPFWKDALASGPFAIELPTDRPRPPRQTFRGAYEPVSLPHALCERLEALGRGRGATLFMTVLAGFQVLLARYSGQDAVVVGTPVAGRTQPELDDLVGCFINVLPLRADLADDPAFEDLLTRTREATLGAVAHQDLPFEKIVDALAVPRDPSRSPVFQTMLSYQSAQQRMRTAGGLRFEQVEHEAPIAKYDLTLALEEHDGTLSGVWEYNTDLFDAATVARMGVHLRTLFEAVAEAPATRVSVLPLLDTAEKRKVLVDWNATDAVLPRDVCIHALIEAQVARVGDEPAVLTDAGSLSYRQLNRRANRVAAHLRALGVTAGTRVGIHLLPTEAALIAMLGVLKAGGAYVPLDPGSPDDRVQYVVRDAGLGIVLTEPGLVHAVASMGVETVVVGVVDAETTEADDANPASIAGPDDLAYVIYTSGSTGAPKGVMVTHRNLVHSTTARFRHYREPVSRYLMVWSFAFDSAVAGTYWTLCQGGALLLPTEALRSDLPRLLRWMGEHAVSHTDAIPSMYALMLSTATPHDLASLRVAIVGGEACPRELVSQHLATVPHAELHNEYGPTEGTVWSTVFHARDASAARTVPIGRPISNARAYVLDAKRTPVPVGVLGELYLGGEGIARGYLGRDDLTRERFVPDGFRDVPGATMYRTGDLARWLPDGTLEFAGRVDHQVKIRGYRVELGEIEEALLRVAGVQLAAVLPREDATRGTRLVAYLEAAGEISDESIRDALRDVLPAYMVPTVFVRLERLPRNANGKVDRRALADRPASEIETQRAEPAAPRNPTERLLAEIWAGALGVATVGVHDDFFALGGHSLLMLSIIARASRAGLSLRPEQIFQHPTVARLAEVVRTASSLGGEEQWSSLVTLQPRGSKPPLFLVHATPGDLFGYVNLVDELGHDQPCYGFQSLGLHATDQAHTSIEAMAAYYVARLREFQPHGPYHLGGWCYGGIVAYEMARILLAAGEDVPLVAMIDAVAPPPSLTHYGYYLDRVRGLLNLGLVGLPRYLADKVRTMREDTARENEDRLQVTIPTGPLANRAHVLGVNMAAMERYRTRPLAHHIALFAPTHAIGMAALDRDQGWTRLVGSIERYDVPGSHDTALQSPNARTLAARLREAIERAQARSARRG